MSNGTAMTAFTRPPIRKEQCKVCDILAALDPQVRDRAVEALAEDMKVWPHTAIAATFDELGHAVSDHSVRVHRQRCA